jgi:hypothetical protein
MKAAVMNFEVNVLARTRDEAFTLMDEMALKVLSEVGGAPWVAHDDDVSREQAPQVTLADENGFLYKGKRTMVYCGPIVHHDGQPEHDGFKVQTRSDEG